MNFRLFSKIILLVFQISHFSIHASDDQISSETPSSESNAQVSSGRTSRSKSLHGLFTMRLKTGFNLATWWGSSSKREKETNSTIAPYSNRIFLPGFTAGAALALRLHKFFSTQPEILYTMKGYKTRKKNKTNSQTEIIKEIIRLHYLEFSVLPKLTLPFSFGYAHIYSGPVIGIKTGFNSYVNRELKGVKYTEKIPEAEIEIMDREYKKSDFGLIMGICLDIGKGTDLFILDIRYTLGLTEINKLSDVLILEGLSEHNIFKHKSNSVSLNIGYALIF